MEREIQNDQYKHSFLCLDTNGHTKLKLLVRFLQHGPEGIPVGALQREMEEEGITDKIPRARLNELLDMADADDNQLVTYNEFINLVMMSLLITFLISCTMNCFSNIVSS